MCRGRRLVPRRGERARPAPSAAAKHLGKLELPEQRILEGFTKAATHRAHACKVTHLHILFTQGTMRQAARWAKLRTYLKHERIALDGQILHPLALNALC